MKLYFDNNEHKHFMMHLFQALRYLNINVIINQLSTENMPVH